MNRILGLAVGLGLAVLPCGAWNAAPQSDSSVRRILVLSSFHNRHPWTAAFLENMHRVIQQRRDVVITDFVELHSARLRDEGFEDRFNLCLPRIRAGKFDAVVAILDDAVNLTLQSCNLFPPGQPILLGGLRAVPSGVKEQYPNITGVVTGCGALASLRIGLALLPDSKNAAFIADGPPRGPDCRQDLPKQLGALPGLQMSYLLGQELPTRQMLDRAAQLPSDTVVIFDSWRAFGRDGYLSPEVVGDQLYRALRHPYMTVDDTMFGHGALGGYVMRGSSQGKAAGVLLNRILDGEPLPRIDFAYCSPELVIDGELAAWYGISPDKLPPGTIFRGREEQGLHVPVDGLTIAGIVLLMLAAGVGAWFCCRHKFGGWGKNAPATADSAARSWRELPCADAETVNRAIAEVFGAGNFRRGEIEFGECRRLAALLRLDPAVFGREGLLCISQDISGQNDTMHRRRLLEQRNHAVLQAITDALAVMDVDGRIIFMNAAAEQLTGCAAGAARGRRQEEVFRLGGESVEQLVAATIASGEVSGPVYEGELSVPGGARIPVGCCCAPIDDGGKVIGAVLLMRDLSGVPDNLPLFRQGMEKMRQGEFSFFRYVPATSGVTPFAAGSFRFRPLREDGTAVPLDEWFTANSWERIRRQTKKICAGESVFITCPVDSSYQGIERSYLASVWCPGGCARTISADIELFGVMQDVTGLLSQERAYHENLVLLRIVAEGLPFPVFTDEEEDEFRYLARNRGGGREWSEDDGECERMFRANREALLEAGREMIEFADRYREPDSGRYGSSAFVRLISLVDGTQLLLGVCVGVSREELVSSHSDAKVAPVMRRILDSLPPDVLDQGIDEQIRLRLWSSSYTRQTGLPEEPKGPEASGTVPSEKTAPAESASTPVLCREDGRDPDAAVRARRIARGKRYRENQKVLARSLNAVTIARQFEISVRELLSATGRAAGADRAYFYRFTGNGIQLGFEWNRDTGKPAEGMALDSVSPGLTSYFGEHELLRIESIDDPNSPMADCAPVLKGANINGLLLHRVIYNGALYGFVGVTMRGGTVRFRAADIAAVSDAAHLFSQARQRRDQMEQLGASARQRKMIFEKMATPAVIFDKDLRIVSVNRECLLLLGVKEDVVGNFCGALHCGAEDAACCAAHACPVWRAMETLEPQAQSHLRDGRMLMRRTQPIFDMDGQLVSIVESVVEQPNDVAMRQETDERQREDLAIYSRELRLYVAQDRAVNRCMEVLAQDNGFYDALQQLTAKVGHELALEDCVLFHFDAEDGGTLMSCESWYASMDTGKPPVRFVFRREFPAFFRELETFGQAAFHWDAIRRQPEMLPYQEEMRRYRDGNDHFDAFCSSVFRAGKFWGFIGSEVYDGRTLTGVGERMMNTAARVVEVLLEQEESRKARLYVERENQALLELLPTAVLLLDGEMNIENINSAAAKIIGVPPDVASSVRFGGLCPVCRSGDHCMVELAIETGTAQCREQMVCGRLYLVNVLPVEIPPRNGKVLVSLVELPENRAPLLESVRKATDAARAKSFFLATLNRELRLPASLPEPLESQSGLSREPVSMIAADLLRMLSRLLELSTLEAEQMRFSPHETDFDRQLEEVRAMIRPLAEARRLTFSLRGPSHPPLLMVDVKRVRQVLLQLLNNAVKFTEAGSIVLAWEFERSDSEYGTLTVRLTDTGCGIAPENQARIFESFVRLNLSADDEEGGGQTVGLGLPIASRLVQCMEGSLTVESAVGCGSTFIMTLPEVHYREQDWVRGQVAELAGAKAGRSILLVDDTAINLRMFSALLRRFGCECRCAASGAEALAQLRYFRPDWVFCDSRMPGMDGAEVAEAIRVVPEWNAIHLAVMIAESESERKLDTGLFDAVLRKPLTAAALGEMLRG